MKDYKDIKTFEDACKIEGLDPNKVIPYFSCLPEQDRASAEAHTKLVIIVRAANKLANDGEEWKADFSDHNQWKYEPWFEEHTKEGGSSGFRYHGFDNWIALSGVGSRLCFISREVCEYIAEQFIELYNQYLG